jgi:hypothetical protein
MSGVAVIRYLLANNAGLTAVVPATRIMAGTLPINTSAPAISVTQISANQRNNTGMASASYIVRERVQVTVVAATYPQSETILSLVHTALPNTRGTINGVSCQAILPDIEGPDFEDEERSLKFRSRDFIVTFLR